MSSIEQIPLNDAERIDASVQSESSKVYAAKKLGKFFKLEVKLYIFDHLVRSWIFPSNN